MSSSANVIILFKPTVCEGKIDNGLAVVRPPGHHAECHCAMGFWSVSSGGGHGYGQLFDSCSDSIALNFKSCSHFSGLTAHSSFMSKYIRSTYNNVAVAAKAAQRYGAEKVQLNFAMLTK